MKRLVVTAVLLLLCISFPTSLTAGSVEDKGKAWLDAQKDPAQINVSGEWDSEFGDLYLKQADGNREVSGNGGGYQLLGVVSGKSLYLLFYVGTAHGGSVDYCAVAASDSATHMVGTYSNRVARRKSHAGLCQEKSRPLNMRKR